MGDFCEFVPTDESCNPPDPVKANLSTFWRPNFSNEDLANVFEILPDSALNSDLGGRQVLYGEKYFPDWVLQLELFEGPSQYNSLNYDGYIYYQEMAWETPTQVGAGRGIVQWIPDQGYAGWVCFYNGPEAADQQYYSCKSVLVSALTDMTKPAPDLKWDEYDTQRGFRCHVEKIGDFDRAQCLMPLPVAQDSYLRGEYRWHPTDRKRIVQHGFVANGTPSDNYWVSLGVVEFQGAMDSLTVTVSFVAAIVMTLF